MTNSPLPKISIIIPTYNRSELLKRAIRSALNQSYSNLEIIIVNDASTDNTEEVIHAFTDKRIRYIKHQTNQKLSASRNSGIKAATGEFICFLDDDDEMNSQKLKKQIDQFANSSPRTGVVYCGWQYMFNNKNVSSHTPQFKGDVFNKFLEHSFIVVHAPLTRKVCFEKVGLFDTSLESCEDWDMWIRISQHYDFDYVPNELVTVHIHEVERMSLSLQSKILARSKILDKYREQLQKYPQAYSAQLGRLGILQYLAKDEQKGMRNIFKSIRHDYSRIKNYFYIILILCDKIKLGTLEHFVIERYGNMKVYY